MTVGWIVCGFYTPDYRHWWDTLRASLELHGAAHDFVETEKLADGWEANTMAKPHQVQAAMDQHPDKVIIFLDVDCEVRGSLEPLVHLTGDVAFYMQTRRRKGDVKWGSIRSGTLVVRPTSRARAFVESWIAQVATFGDVDQNTLMLAVCATPGCTFEPLPVAYCAVASDKIEHPVILHDSAAQVSTRSARWPSASRAGACRAGSSRQCRPSERTSDPNGVGHTKAAAPHHALQAAVLDGQTRPKGQDVIAMADDTSTLEGLRAELDGGGVTLRRVSQLNQANGTH